jgi:Tfp pilus assembly protein PilF
VCITISFTCPPSGSCDRATEYLQQNRLNDAIIEYRKILEDNPYDFVTNFRIANVYLKLNERDQAAQHYEKVLDVNKFNYEVER